MTAGELGVSTLDGVSIMPSEMLTRYLCILPMGFSWSLHFCQQVLMNGIKAANISNCQTICNKKLPVCLTKVSDVGVAGYADNFAVLGHCKKTVDKALDQIIQVLRGLGLVVHEITHANCSGVFVGLEFHG